MRTDTIAALLVVAVGAACGGNRSTKWEGSITDSAGVAIVQNPATGLWGPGEGWTLTEALRIGTAEGEPEYQFGQLLPAGSIGIASDGRIVVFDAQGQHIKVFKADGKYERTIGRAGNGPGEIGPGQQSTLLIAPGDTVFLSDLGNQRVSLFLLDGTFVRSFPLDLASGIPFRWEEAADGRIVAQMRRLAFPGSTTAPDSMDAITVRRLDGTVGDTLMRLKSGKTISFTGGLPEWNFFTPEPLWALWGTRILQAVNDNYRINVYLQGKLERVVEKPFTLDPVTDADQLPMKESLKKLMAAQGAPPQLITQLVDTRMHFAPNYPAFAQMLAGPYGTILVQSVVPIAKLSAQEREHFDFLSGSMGSRDWDVFDDQGRYLGAVTMPQRFQPVQFRGDNIYGIQRDDLDVQYVVKLAIAKPAE
jgi:6-bladed beta-propeller